MLEENVGSDVGVFEQEAGNRLKIQYEPVFAPLEWGRSVSCGNQRSGTIIANGGTSALRDDIGLNMPADPIQSYEKFATYKTKANIMKQINKYK